MRQPFVNLFLILILAFQGVSAVGADIFPDHEMQQHCAGHDMTSEDCSCCPEGAIMGASCTVQCSVSQTAVEMQMPPRLMVSGPISCFADRSIRDPVYVPLVPPPIC
jgi:hypothetical protein